MFIVRVCQRWTISGHPGREISPPCTGLPDSDMMQLSLSQNWEIAELILPVDFGTLQRT
jgi:hypothetical protein